MLQITDYEEILVIEKALEEHFNNYMKKRLSPDLTECEIKIVASNLQFIAKTYQDVKKIREEIRDNIPGGR